jgi:hypothetical protein
MQKYATVCKSMQKYAKVCKSMQKYAKVCKIMQHYVKVCKSMQKFDICFPVTGVHIGFLAITIGFLVKDLGKQFYANPILDCRPDRKSVGVLLLN